MLDSPLQLALSKRLLFVTGKGGIGKSLIAASLALEASRLGKSVYLVQQSAKDHLGPLFGRDDIGHELLEVLPGLSVANFNTGGNFRDFIIKHLRHGSLFDMIASNRVLHSFFAAIPGFGELMLLGRLYYTLNLAPVRPDLVIVDGYASGHFQSLMTTPSAVIKSGLGGPILAETQRVDAFLRQTDQCGVLLVGVLEELVITEMVDLLKILSNGSPTKVSGILFNRCIQGMGEDQLSGESEAVQFLMQKAQKQQLAWRLWQTFAQREPVAGLPSFKAPELGFVDDPLTSEVAAALINAQRQPVYE